MNRQFADRIQPLAPRWGFVLFCVFWAFPAVNVSDATGSMLTLPDIADTFSRKFAPDATSGTKTFMKVHGPNEKQLSFVRFDVSGLNDTVSAATLKLYVREVLNAGIVDVRVVQDNWSELQLTHNNKPMYSAAPVTSLALSPADEGTVVSLEITGLVQQWAASPATAFGIALTSQNLNARFDTREGAHAPAVEVMLNGSGNTPPSVAISQPTDGARFSQGETVTFAATATDAEEGSLTGSLQWRSNVDGSLGSGGSFSLSTLSVGTHTVTASVSDSSGGSGSDSIQVVIESDSSGQGVRFQDVSDLLGNLPDTRTWGISWADYDDDGWVDVFLNNHVNVPTLLRNNGGTAFVDVTQAAGVADKADHHSCDWADYDNDGDLDLYCTTGAKRGTGSVPANFWRNNGNSTFTDIAASTNTENGTGRGRSVNWFDFDLDGDLDLFVGHEVKVATNPVSKLYRNNGGSFVDVAAQAGVDVPSEVQYSTVFDYDGDGDWDLLWNYRDYTDSGYPCSPSCILIMRNDGQGHFVPRTGGMTGITARAQSMVTVGDYDNDGDIDIFSGSKTSASKHLYLNNANGTFDKVSASAAGFSPILNLPLEQGISADFDNDGSLDLFLVLNDEDSSQPNKIFFGNGDGTFTDGSSGAGVEGTNDGLADVAATADFNNDGFLDVLIGYGLHETPGPYELLRNVGNSNHWLRVRLTSSGSSTVLGSKIWVMDDGRTQYREYADQSDGQAFHEPVAHFGLGASTNVDRLRVQWPDGTISEWSNVAADQVLTLLR